MADSGGKDESATREPAGLELVELPGSERTEVRGAQPAAAALSTDTEIGATIVLRRRAAVPDAVLSGPGMTPAELAAAYGADPGDVAKVSARLSQLGLQVVEADAATRRVQVRGPISLMERVFGTSLQPVTHRGPVGNVSDHRVRSGALSIPSDLAGIVTGVLGLDNRPQTRALYQIAHSAEVSTSYTPLQLATVYDFPDGTDGTGQTIAIIELGGGFSDTDLNQYFSGLGITGPKVTAVGVDGAQNQPGQDPQGADGEVLLDIEVAGALAPKADIVVYFAPNTDAGFLNAIATAAHAEPTPTAISISWGQGENQWTEQARNAMDQAFVDAAALGVTVTTAAGDDGSTDRETDGSMHVDFPASSPHALACGGTSLKADVSTGRVTSETVWNNGTGKGATGGGYSVAFDRPSWQDAALGSNPSVTATTAPPTTAAASPAAAPTTGRGVPDVAADADPKTGYQVLIDGSTGVIGGTSAVAPLWAALVARLAQANGAKFGLIQPKLYAAAIPGTVAPGFRDVTEGNNGAYAAGPGWDACTGLGVPVGSALGAVVGTTGPTRGAPSDPVAPAPPS
jgi:kumamolisin